MIRWISEFLGTASRDRIAEHQDVHIIDVRDMVDKPGNTPRIAREKIEQGVAFLERGERVVVCCDYGISRSNAIAAGILSLYKGLTLNEAVREVIQTTGEKDIKIDVLSVVREALESNAKPPQRGAKSREILVTGSSGFIGRALVARLAAENQVYAPTRNEVDLAGGAVALDLYVREHDIECLVHLANPRVYNTNQALGESLVLLKSVLDVCRLNHLKLIYLSNWEVYSGYRDGLTLASETLPPHPKGLYGETKYLCELLLERHCQNYGIESILVRSSTVYGRDSDRPRFIFNFLQKAVRDEEIVAHKYLNGFPTLDLLYVDDLITALLSALSSDYCGILHLGSARSISTTNVAELIVEMTGSKSQIKHREIQDFAPNVVMDCARAEAVLGWQPKTSFEEGLRTLLPERIPPYTVAKENS